MRAGPCLLFWLCICPAAHSTPQRVVTLSPHATELVIAAGAADRLVGAATAPDQALPAQRQSTIAPISSLGGIDREQLLRLQPDFVVAWPSGNRPSDLRWLKAKGIDVFYSEPRTLREIASDIRKLGQQLGTSESAERAATRFEQQLQAACPARTSQKIYVAIWPTPAMSVGGQHWLNDALAYANLRNTFAQVPLGVFSPDPENLLAQQQLPQVALHPWARKSDKDGRGLSRPAPSILPAITHLCDQTTD